ncbi:MAG TPA: hypothetical protein VFJ58_28615 [Armatimonadota bacterium]|nr:hypothetical protein [Armatimonadota bacterium]
MTREQFLADDKTKAAAVLTVIRTIPSIARVVDGLIPSEPNHE